MKDHQRGRGRPPSATLQPGQRFGRVVAIRPSKIGGRWLVRCDCGREVTLFVSELAGSRGQPRRRGCGVKCGLAVRVHYTLIPRGLTGCGKVWNSKTKGTGTASEVTCVKCLRCEQLDPLAWARWALPSIRRAARRRAFGCDLTLQDILDVRVGKPCHYCGGELPTLMIGLDRKDSDRGYTRDNIVACCQFCNDAKGHLLSHDEYMAAMSVRLAGTGPGNAWTGRPWRSALKVRIAATSRNG